MSKSVQETVVPSITGLSSSLIYIPYHVPSSKNSRVRTRQGTFIASKSVRQYRKLSAKFWKSEKDNFSSKIKGKSFPLRIGFHFIRKTHHKYDWLNPSQTIQDEMVKHDWLEDDNMEFIIPIPFQVNREFSTVSKAHQGVIIKIF